MDKEAQEKVAEGMYFADRCQFCHGFGGKVEPYLCPRCVEKIGKLGYRKLPEGEPPLLSKLQVTKVLLDKYPGFDPEFDIDYDAIEVTNQAQRDSDVKWYRGL